MRPALFTVTAILLGLAAAATVAQRPTPSDVAATEWRHYGSDASLDAAAHEAIARWLQQHAGSSRRLRGDATPPPEDRISRAPWFLRKHRKVPARIWSHPEVRSAARCEACRQGAARGDFDDHAVRLPR